MEKVKYIVYDGENGDVVYKGNSLREAKNKALLYDEGCEGDWIPVVKYEGGRREWFDFE